MRIRTFASAAAMLALGLAMWITPAKVQAQPLFDRVDVNLPYTVTIGNKTLQPGSYVIQQLESASGDSRVLLIYGDNGMKFETSALTIPTLDPNTARETKVILHHFGNDYYFDKVWIQGKDYGYEFPLPNSVKQRENEAMQPVTVAATYSSVPAPATTAPATTAPATTAPATTPPAATAETTPPPATQAQNTPPPATQPQATVPPATTANRSMPNTSAGWLMMLISGGALCGAGLCLRRKAVTAGNH